MKFGELRGSAHGSTTVPLGQVLESSGLLLGSGDNTTCADEETCHPEVYQQWSFAVLLVQDPGWGREKEQQPTTPCKQVHKSEFSQLCPSCLAESNQAKDSLQGTFAIVLQ